MTVRFPMYNFYQTFDKSTAPVTSTKTPEASVKRLACSPLDLLNILIPLCSDGSRFPVIPVPILTLSAIKSTAINGQLRQRSLDFYQQVQKDHPKTCDAEYLIGLFANETVSIKKNLIEKTHEILNANKNPKGWGVYEIRKMSDQGFSPFFKDSTVFATNNNGQPGHFLTALAMGFRGVQGLEALAMRLFGFNEIGTKAMSISEEDLVLYFAIGHELLADPLEEDKSSLSNAFAFTKQFATAFNKQEYIQAFKQALEKLCYYYETNQFDIKTIQEYVFTPLENVITINEGKQRGNSSEDLRLTLIGYWLGKAIQTKKITNPTDVANLLRNIIMESSSAKT